MKDRDLKFDRQHHMIYSKAVKEVIYAHLTARYTPQEAEKYWEDIQMAYVKMLDLIPYMGGSKNGQAGSVYDCAALFAFYQSVPDKPNLEEFEEMNNELFLPAISRAGFADLNKPLFMKAADFIYRFLARRSVKNREKWPGNYHMETVRVPEGTKYVFTMCPIAELARKLHYEHLMPAMCNPDYIMLKSLHGGLIRTGTCGFSDHCDFWVVGDKSRMLEEHPRKKNAEGYLYNE